MNRLLNATGEVIAWLLITPADTVARVWRWLTPDPACRWANLTGDEDE